MTETKVGLWDYVKDISHLKEGIGLESEGSNPDYVPFIINRAFSYYSDTILIANEANQKSTWSKQMHYDFMFTLIRPRKRYSKWCKPERIKECELVAKYFECNLAKAADILEFLSEEDLKEIKISFEDGIRK